MRGGVGTSAKGRGWLAATLAALVLLAFALRLYHLRTQSLWYDEAISFYYSARDLPTLFFYLTQDNHPPLYFLLLHLWIGMAGRSEFALRSLSVAMGVLAVPLAYVVGRQAFGRRGAEVGLVTAFLVALSPWYVWYSQETRMYSLATTLGLLSTYLLLRAWADNRMGLWLAYVLAAAAGLYTHYYVALLLLGQASFFLASCLLVHHWRPLRRWVASQVGIVLLFLPWSRILLARAASDATYWPGTMAFAQFLLQSATAFAVGDTLAGTTATIALAVVIFLVAVGLIAPVPRPDRAHDSLPPASAFFPGRTFLLLSLAVPVLALYGLVAQRPKFDPRYLLPASPAVYLAMGAGVAALVGGRGRGEKTAGGGSPSPLSVALNRSEAVLRAAGASVAAAALALWLRGAGQSLSNLFFDDEYARTDFRGVVRYVEERARPDDAVVLVGGHSQVLFDYYASRGLDVYPLPRWIIPDVNRTQELPETLRTLEAVAARHPRVWLVLWQDNLADPTHLVLHQLWANSSQIQLDQGFRGVDLRLYAFTPNPYFSLETRVQHSRSDNFGDQVELLGFDTDRTVVESGGVLAVTLYWRARARLGEDLTAFVHLLNAADRVYAQIDRRPVNDFYTTSRWLPGQTVRDAYYLTVPPGTPPGQYLIEVGLYRYPSLERLKIVGSGEDRVVLLPVQVVRGASAKREPEVQRRQPVSFGPLELLGYDLERERYRPGEELRVRLAWRAGAKMAERRWVSLSLVNEADRVLSRAEAEPADGTYPTTQWDVGEVVRDFISLLLPPDLAEGIYHLRVGAREESGPAPPEVPLGTPIVVKK